MSNNSYCFADVKCSLTGPGGSVELGEQGVADEGIDFAFTGDKNTMTTGASGDGMHSLHAGQPGSVTVRLLKTSPLNAILSAMFASQTASSANHGQNTITLNDAQRGDNWVAVQCAFRKHPDGKWAKEGNIQEWIFDSTRITPKFGSGKPSIS